MFSFSAVTVVTSTRVHMDFFTGKTGEMEGDEKRFGDRGYG
jgi:hypothetical protein